MNYESDWFDISEYVLRWGIVKKSFGDSILFGEYVIDNITINVDNSTQKFTKELGTDSLFNGFKTRYKTKFKVEVGFYDSDFYENFANAWYFIMLTEPSNSDSNIVELDLTSTLGSLKLYTAEGIDTSTKQTDLWVDAIIKKEVNGARLFDRIFEGDTDSDRYKITAGTITVDGSAVEDGATCWDELVKYSKYEGYFPYVDIFGHFIWADRSVTSTDIKWYFNGAGSGNSNETGVKIVSLDEEVDGITDSYQYISIQYQSDPLYVSSKDSWTPGDGSIPDIYGEKSYSFEALELTQAQAQNVADNLLSILKTPKKKWYQTTCFIPHLELKDRVMLNYSGELTNSNAFTLDSSKLSPTGRDDAGYDQLSGYQGAINIQNQECFIISLEIDLDNFLCKFELKEV